MNFRKLPAYNTLVKPYLFARSFHAASKNNYPASGIKVIGVTGSNGKTSTTWMIFNILREKYGDKVGVMSTIGWGHGDAIMDQTAHATTEDADKLQAHIAKLASEGVQFLVLEVSSHALAQRRVFGIPFDAAVFTNLVPDHLDYHKTMEKYSQAKQRLFSAVEKSRDSDGFGVINFDDAEFANFAKKVSQPVSYSLNNRDADLSAENIKLTPNGIEYNVKMSDAFRERLGKFNENFAKKFATKKAKETFFAKFCVKTQIPGEFNVYNSLAATAIGLKYGLSQKEIIAGIAKTRVAGRMNSVDEGQDFSAIIDFATTPEAFENVFPAIRKTAKGKIISVFGLAGERDEAKAPGMGKTAAKYSEMLILTEEDARGDIRTQSEKIAAGVPKDWKGKIEFIDDRTEAINAAMKFAKKGDTVVIFGKGPEKTIARKRDGVIHEDAWDEEATVRAGIKLAMKNAKK